MPTAAEETARAQGYLDARLEERSKILQELKAGQQQIIEMLDRTNARTNERIDQANARIDRANTRTNARIDRLNERFDRIMLAGWIAGGVAIITAQMGMLGTLIVLTIRMGSGS